MPRAGLYLAAWVLLSSARAEQLPAVVYTVREGLPSATIPRIVVDSKGLVWFPSGEGLARFDGNNFRVFTAADGLPAGGINDVFERRDGTYWIAAQEHLCRYDPLSRRRRFECESPGIGVIQTLLEDERTVWCGTDRGLWRRSATGAASWERLSAIQPTAPNRSIAVGRLLCDSRGDVWAATYSGLYRFRAGGRVDRWTRAQGLIHDSITTVAETPDAIWAGSQTELLRLQVDPRTGEARIAARYGRPHGLPSGYTTDILFWRGSVWGATFQGLARLLPSGRWQGVDLDPGLRGIALEALAADALGNLWVGTTGAGAARAAGSGLSSFTERDGLAGRKVWAVFEDRDGRLVAVTKDEDDYALNRFDGYRFHAVRPRAPSGIRFGWSWSQIALHSRTGDWWLATGGGLLRYARRLDRPPVQLGPEDGLPRGNIFRIFEDSTGAIWASRRAVSAHGLFRLKPGARRFENLEHSPGLPSLQEDANCPSAFAEDRGGGIWIGMFDGGLVAYRNGKFRQLAGVPLAPRKGVRALLVDRAGRLWVGTRGQGLLRIDDPSAENPNLSSYTTAQGLAGNTIHALAEDRDGRIWAAGGSVLERLDPVTGRVRHFTGADGLPAGDLRAAFRDRHGGLWFGGDQGLVRIKPQEDRPDPPAVLVQAIRVNGLDQPLSDLGELDPAPLSLSASQRQVQVDFGGLRHDLLYQTRLTGVDRDWTPPSASRSVHYLSLAPGSYELAIRALAPEGLVSDRPARVRFRIAAPVWQRWWFLLSSAAALAAIVYAVHRYRVAQAVALERVRTRIASDLHDDIGASLSLIAVLSEVARWRLEAHDPRAAEPLGRIGDISRELIDSMSDIVWAINPRHDRLADLVSRMRRFAGDLLSDGAIRFELEVLGPASIPLHATARRDVFLIFKESLHNAARHSGCSAIQVQVGTENGRLKLRVADDGRGFAAEAAQERGQGLESMRRRAAKLGGSVSIASGETGTSVELVVPLSRRDPVG